MKVLSLVLTILLVIPLLYSVFSTYESYRLQSILIHGEAAHFMLLQLISTIIQHLLYLVVAIVLNSKQKYYANSLICGTLLVSFAVSLVFYYGLTIVNVLEQHLNK